MKRREVFSSLTLGIVGAVSLPSWANNWTAQNLKPDSLELNTSEEDLLDDICEAIIPETDTPGSRTLQIPKFVKTKKFMSIPKTVGKCLHCAKSFEGNKDKKFCDDRCRTYFHNIRKRL